MSNTNVNQPTDSENENTSGTWGRVVDALENTPMFGGPGSLSFHADVLSTSGSEAIMVYGEDGNDQLTGATGDDVLSGDEGMDTLIGNAGDDLLLVDNADTFDGGDGWDTVVFTDDVNHDVDMHSRKVERVIGGDGDDVISGYHVTSGVVVDGGGGDDYLRGSGRDDVIHGGDGDDALHGRRGDDVLLGGAGRDNLQGHYGDDVLYVDAADSFDGGEGWDTVVFTDDVGHDVDLQARGVERVFGGDGNDRLNGGWRNDTYHFNRGDGVDTIHDNFYANGQQNDGGNLDVLQFGDGIDLADLVMQMSGTDLLIGIKAKDATTTTDLSALTDVVRIKDYANRNNAVEELAFANGTRMAMADVISTLRIVVGGAAVDLSAAQHGGTITNTDGSLTLVGDAGHNGFFGDIGNDIVLGGDGNDCMYGRRGNDVLHGGGGGDWMYGQKGDDVLYGGDGNDALYGDGGSDALYGGLGDDAYYFGYDDVQNDTMHDIGGDDKVIFDGDVSSNIWLTRNGDDLRIRLLDSDRLLTVEDHFAGEATLIESFHFGGADVNANRVDSLVNAMAAFTEPKNGLGDLSTVNHAAVTAAWQQAGVNLA